MSKIKDKVYKYALPVVLVLGIGYFLVHGGVSVTVGCDQDSCGVKSGMMIDIPNPLAPKVQLIPSF